MPTTTPSTDASLEWGYIRVSAQDQQTDRQEKAMQDAAIPEARIFRDKISGATMVRPGLSKLLDGSHARRGDVIVVDGLDRLGRTTLGVLQVLEDLDGRGIAVRSVKPGETKLEGATGKMIRDLMLVLASWEREMNRERVAEARAARIAAGKPVGRPKTALAPITVKKVRALRADGWTMPQIAADLSISRASAYRALAVQT